jgi:hypothetical protein
MPAILMGAGLPLLAPLAAGERGVGRGAGALYAANTPGGAAGCFPATALDVFPHVSAWSVPASADVFLLATIGIRSGAQFVECCRADEVDLRRWIRRPAVNSDWRPAVEFPTASIPAIAEAPRVARALFDAVRPETLIEHLEE